MQPQVWQKIGLGLLAALLVGLALATSQVPRSLAQGDSGLRSDISSLRADVSFLSSRVSRLENAIARLNPFSRQPPQPLPESRSQPPARILDGVPVGPSDPMFERLATLVIELKERVTRLEARLDSLEEKNL